MGVVARQTFAEIEARLCEFVAEKYGLPRHGVLPKTSFVEDLGIDSLDLVDLIMGIEEKFEIALPNDAPNPVYKSIFTRSPFRLADMAELIYLQQGTGAPERSGWWKSIKTQKTLATPFTQLDGIWQPLARGRSSLFEPLKGAGPLPQFRRSSDGMRCIRLPSASVEIGCDATGAQRDEQPQHAVQIDAFLIDCEPVSTTAYCRFLNSIEGAEREVLEDWFVLEPADDRNEHMLIACQGGEWRSVAGTERLPMILVSWYGANAYSLWVNGRDWRCYRDDADATPESFLPSEAQWEYAARGPRYQPFPWGSDPPTPERMRYGQHQRSATYRAETLPMAAVNEPLGVSPFGLNHMAGNVWQWCRDWYDLTFYSSDTARMRNPINRTPTGVRCERGGSWVGSAELCRSSYRRGRPPAVRGRCLGFRCVSAVEDVAR